MGIWGGEGGGSSNWSTSIGLFCVPGSSCVVV